MKQEIELISEIINLQLTSKNLKILVFLYTDSELEVIVYSLDECYQRFKVTLKDNTTEENILHLTDIISNIKCAEEVCTDGKGETIRVQN